jgi:hypothetical protein
MGEKGDAVEQLRHYAALTEDEASALVDAVVAAAAGEAIDQIANDALIPASVADARVVRLARICAHLGRLLSPTEIEVVLRVPPSTARSTVRRLRALYRSEIEQWIRSLVTSQLAETEDASSELAGQRWRFTFNDPNAIEYAMEILRREGMTRDIAVNEQQQSLTVPKQMRDRQGNRRDSKGVLGL